MRKQIIVVAAIIHHDNKFLIVQRSLNKSDLQAGLWEFPGGKVEFGEKPEDALRREIMEELNMQIHALELFDVSSDMLKKEESDLHAVMIVYNCKVNSVELTLHSGNDFRWIERDELDKFEFALLDIPVIEKMIK